MSTDTPAVVCHGLDTPERVHFYEQEFYPFSSFSSFKLKHKGIVFPTLEHAYHWRKFSNRLDIQHMIISAPSAHEAFQIAQALRDERHVNWDDFKVGVMRELVEQKFEQHGYVRKKLQETGDREIVENSWRDDFWGWGPNHDGKNILGRIWMECRAYNFQAVLHARLLKIITDAVATGNPNKTLRLSEDNAKELAQLSNKNNTSDLIGQMFHGYVISDVAAGRVSRVD